MAENSSESVDCGMEPIKKTAASKVFDTARDLFYRRGIRAVGVDEIVFEAGVTKPSLYRAFKSKDDLVAACLQESAKEGREAILAAVAAAGDDPQDRLRAVVRHFADKLLCPEFRGCLMSNVAIELSEPGHPGRVVAQNCKKEMRALTFDLARELNVAEPELLADGVILAIEGAIATHHILGSQGPAQSLVATCDGLIELHLGRRVAVLTQ
ncbi:MAG: helix-turn-helix domain-containing protein [Novosphingobium sp.]